MIRQMVKLCIPTILSLFMVGMYSVIDGLFVGRSTGDIGLAAINIAWPITALITAVGTGIGTGCSVLYSHQQGEGLEEESQITLHNGFTYLIVSGLALTIFLLVSYKRILWMLGATGEVLVEAEKYSRIIIVGGIFQIFGSGLIPILRNMDLPVQAMTSMIMGMLTNLVINYYLVVKVKVGIQGAAYGTLIAQAVVSLISLGIIIKSKGYRPKIILSLKKVIDIGRSGLSAFGVSFAPSLALMITNKQCLSYGGEEAVACYAVISYIVFPVHSMLTGIGDGSQPLISFYSGAREKTKLEEVKKIAYKFILVLGIVIFGVVFLARGSLAKWFGLSSHAAIYFNNGMLISMLSFLVVGFTKFGIAYFNATLQVKEAMLLIYGESIFVSPLLLWILPMWYGLEGVWLSLPITGFIMIVMFLYIMKKKDRS